MQECIKIKTDISEETKQNGHHEKVLQLDKQQKGEQLTFIGNKESMNASQYTRVTFSYLSHSRPTFVPAYHTTTVQTVINPRTQIVYYPVIHNKLVLASPIKSRRVSSTHNSSNVQKRRSSGLSTPIRNREQSIETKDVLTPEQFRRLSSHSKK